MRMVLILPCLLFALTDIAVAAEAKSPGTSSSASKFYVVQPDGKSRVQDPVREGEALGADKRLSGKGQNDGQKKGDKKNAQPVAKGSPRKSPAGKSTMTRRSSQDRPPRDESAAFRCEQFGFYYTKDGRCIRPALRRPTAPPEPPRPPAGVTQPR